MIFCLFLLFEILSIFFYMKGGVEGPVFFMLNFLLVLFCKESKLYKMFTLLIMSLPFSFIGIGGMEMTHVLSWYNLFLLLFLVFNLRSLHLSLSAGLPILFIFFCLTIGTLWSVDPAKAWTEIIQIMVMLLPTSLVFCSRRNLNINSKQINQLISIYGHVAFCTAVGMLIQYYFLFFKGTQIGMVFFTGGNRISCFCLFRGASILPVYMGSGLMALFMQNFSKKSLFDIAEMLIIFMAMVLNTSRTGVFSLFCVIGYVMFLRLMKNFSFKTAILSVFMIIVAYFGMDSIMSSRERLESFTETSGRETTIFNGINIWLDSPRNFLFGEGFTGGMWEGITKTHNFVIQTLAQNGLIVAVMIFSLIIVYVRKTNKDLYKYVVWFIVLSGMMVTDFYANAFTSIVFILVSLHCIHPELIGTVKFKKLL